VHGRILADRVRDPKPWLQKPLGIYLTTAHWLTVGLGLAITIRIFGFDRGLKEVGNLLGINI